MANTVTISNNITNQNNFNPTGVVNCVSGMGNPYPIDVGNNQQINVGDPLFMNNDATFGNVAFPACCISGNTFTGANNAPASTTAWTLLQQAFRNNFAGFAVGYRSPKNTSYGKNSDRIGVLPSGRFKLPVDPNANGANGSNGLNSQGVTPVGTLWTVSCNLVNQNAGNYNGTVNCGLYTVCGNGNYLGNNTGATYAIARQVEPKAASATFVTVEAISSIIFGGVQNLAST
jgi:hypothetical protein